MWYNLPMENCIFCKIVHKEIPSSTVYEDEKSIAFLSIQPDNIGHMLVLPKGHFANIYETPDDVLGHIMSVAKKISVGLKSSLSAEGINIIINNEPSAGQAIFHTHVHVIPRYEGDGLIPWKGKRGYEKGEMQLVTEKIKRVLA